MAGVWHQGCCCCYTCNPTDLRRGTIKATAAGLDLSGCIIVSTSPDFSVRYSNVQFNAGATIPVLSPPCDQWAVIGAAHKHRYIGHDCSGPPDAFDDDVNLLAQVCCVTMDGESQWELTIRDNNFGPVLFHGTLDEPCTALDGRVFSRDGGASPGGTALVENP